YGCFPPVRLQAPPPRISTRRLPSPHPRVPPSPRHSCGTLDVCCSLRDERLSSSRPASVCGPLTALVPPEPRGPRSSRVIVSLPSSLGDLIRQSGDLCLFSQLCWL